MRGILPSLVVALAAATAAGAARPVSVVLDRPAAAPHTFVVAKTAGKGALRRVRRRVPRLYLGDVRLGRLDVNRKGNGRLRFEVPNVPAGRYPVRLRGFPQRRSFRVVATFDVVDALAPVRGCESSVYGRLTDDAIARGTHAGPLTFLRYGPAYDRVTGEYAEKALLLVERGPAVTLSIAPEDRRSIALSYIYGRLNDHRVTAGDATVTFVPCGGDESRTQFNGGFVYRQPLCAHLDLRVEGRPEPIPFALPFGKAC